jgi:hypothetical protein
MATYGVEKVVSVKEEDHLDQDKPIRNQNFVCLSFLSPEDVLLEKEVAFFSKYTGAFSKGVSELFTALADKYPNDKAMLEVIRENHAHVFDVNELQDNYKFFKAVNRDELESEFHKEHEFKTSVRGIKVRGVYDTLKEAQVRAEVLKKMGDKFNIYVAQVGCWCPWSPNPEELENQEYSETMLNTLMNKYKENVTNRDEFYAMRKDEKIKNAKIEAEKITQNNLLSDKEADPSKTATDILDDASVDIERVKDGGEASSSAAAASDAA